MPLAWGRVPALASGRGPLPPIVGIRRRTGLAPGHDAFDLLGIERLIPHQGVRHRVKPIQIVGEQLASAFVVPLHYGPHLLVDLARGLNGEEYRRI